MTSPERAIIEVTIPLDYFDVDDMNDLECSICMHPFCKNDCPRHMIQLSCCRQYTCAECLTKSTRRCKCQQSCKQIIVTCPFCRDMCPVNSIALFCARSSLCATCFDHTSSSSDDESTRR